MPNVVPGHTYRIELKTVFDTAILSVALQQTIANFDNIRLRVEDGTPGFKEPGAITDPATNITATSATLNGRVNARGLPTTFVYNYGTNATGPLTSTLPTTGTYNGGQLQEFVSRPRDGHRADGVHDVLLRDRRNQLGGHDVRRQAVVRHRVQARRRDARRRLRHDLGDVPQPHRPEQPRHEVLVRVRDGRQRRVRQPDPGRGRRDHDPRG